MCHTLIKTTLAIAYFITFSNFAFGNSIICYDDPSSAVVLKNQEDIDSLASLCCQVLNASLLINFEGESSVDLTSLNSIQVITGYLAVIHSPIVKDLSVFKNVQVLGEDLYQNQYGIAILDNDDLENPTEGLCWADKVDWSMITSHPFIVSGNAQNCSECHPQCQNCWVGDDISECQKCQNFQTGANFTYLNNLYGYSSCIAECPEGTIVNPEQSQCPKCSFPPNGTDFCWERLPPSPLGFNLTVRSINTSTVEISWIRPSHPNGLILRYGIYRNDTYDHDDYIGSIQNVFGSDGFGQSEFTYLDTGLTPDTFYTYTIRAQNHFGSNDLISKGNWTFPNPPETIGQIQTTILGQTNVSLNWTTPGNTSVEGFRFKFDDPVDFESPVRDGDDWTLELSGLQPGETYTGKVWTVSRFNVESVLSFRFHFQLPSVSPIWSEDQLRVSVPDLPTGAYQIDLEFDPFDPNPGQLTQIEYQIRKHGDEFTAGDTLDYQSNNLSISDLVPNTLYDVRVRVSSEWGGFGNYSEWIQIRTQVGPPPDPCDPLVVNFDEKTSTLMIEISPMDQTNGNLTVFLDYDSDSFSTPIHSIDITGLETVELEVNSSLWLQLRVYTDPYWTKNSSVIHWIYPDDTVTVSHDNSRNDLWDYWYFWLVVGGIILLILIILYVVVVKCRRKRSRKTHPAPSFRDPATTQSYNNPLYTSSLQPPQPPQPEICPYPMMYGDSKDSEFYRFPKDSYPGQYAHLDDQGFVSVRDPSARTYDTLQRGTEPESGNYDTLERQRQGVYISVESSRFDSLKDQAAQSKMVPRNMVYEK